MVILMDLTLWLCQNSWKWPIEIVDVPINSMVIFHSYVNVYQRVTVGDKRIGLELFFFFFEMILIYLRMKNFRMSGWWITRVTPKPWSAVPEWYPSFILGGHHTPSIFYGVPMGSTFTHQLNGHNSGISGYPSFSKLKWPYHLGYPPQNGLGTSFSELGHKSGYLPIWRRI